MKIILATTSKHRIEILKSTGIKFVSEASDVDEYLSDRPTDPIELVKYLSKIKAEDVSKNHSDSLVIGMDSIVYFNSQILEKPKSYDEAFNRLKMLSGNSHKHYTGISLINTKTNNISQEVVETTITIRKISDKEIKEYLDNDSEENYKTHCYGYEAMKDLSSTFIENINGDFFSFARGIPLAKIKSMIDKEVIE